MSNCELTEALLVAAGRRQIITATQRIHQLPGLSPVHENAWAIQIGLEQYFCLCGSFFSNHYFGHEVRCVGQHVSKILGLKQKSLSGFFVSVQVDSPASGRRRELVVWKRLVDSLGKLNRLLALGFITAFEQSQNRKEAMFEIIGVGLE